MRKISTLALLVILMFSLLVSAWAQTGGKEIAGRVTGRMGDAKGLASVTLSGPNTYTAMTNSTGEFRVRNVVKGRYTVSVTQGNNVQRFVVDIDGASRLDLEVRW
jgi:outer membrane lipoprotein-sorting protein